MQLDNDALGFAFANTDELSNNDDYFMTIGRILTHINLGIALTRRRDTEKRVCTFEESVEFYRFNLKLRRYLHDETSIKTDLSDQDSGDSMNDDTSFNQDDFVSSLYDTKNIDESI